MDRKGLKLAVFAAVVAAQLAVPAWMIVRRELTLREGRLFKFRTQPVDPVDAFRGRYVQLRLEPDAVTTPPAARWTPRQRAYAVLTADSNGFARVVRLDRRPPPSEPAIAVRVGYASGADTVHLVWPLDRYYMEEKKAPAAEIAYREHSRRTNRTCHVTVRVRDGNAVIEGLFIEDKPIREFLTQEPVTHK
jgi:uncharacterized membrane-anchored protein